MGGRGESSKRAGAAGVMRIGGNTTDLEQVARMSGFGSVEEMRNAAQFQKTIDEGGDTAKILKFIAEHPRTGGSLLGPIMLRIGLPRSKFLDILNTFKPLSQHGILTLQMPITLRNTDPFRMLSRARSANGQERADLESSMLGIKIETDITQQHLKRIITLPPAIRKQIEGGR